MIPRLSILALLGFLALLPAAWADDNNSSSSSGTRWITYQSSSDKTIYLEDNRKPALYTSNFGDCLGSSLVNVTRFDAAYYQDNMTIMFHLAGNSVLNNQSVMIYIGVYAYGESRFDLTFNPCLSNINSLCPMNSSVPISANGIIPIGPKDVENIPPIALTIPDFEGQAILRIFANATQSEIGCYSAVVTNGGTFSQPASVGTILGLFTLIAIVASIATAVYGEAIPTMRLHYAHSLSVGVVFAVFQHIFFTGALSVNWPSCLVAWWSNFAWAGGMIYTDSMQASINNLIGKDIGNTSAVGAAPTGSTQESLGGGYDISSIYGRAVSMFHPNNIGLPANHPLRRDIASEIYSGADSLLLRRSVVQKSLERTLARRDDLANSSTGFVWYGHPVSNGLPLPGNFSGFAGTLAQENIQVSNAFMTGFLWFLIFLFILVGSVVAMKWIVEGLTRTKYVRKDRLTFFREHWVKYATAMALRTCYLAFFMITFLAIFQFTYQSPAAVKAIAAVVFFIFLVGVGGLTAYACLYKTRVDGSRAAQKEKRGLLRKAPSSGSKKPSPLRQQEADDKIDTPDKKGSSRPFWQRLNSRTDVQAEDEEYGYSIHDDDDYITKFGWLASRYRRTRWWFFAYWVFYELVRACFYGGASGYPLVQVFGLLIVEIIAFCFVLWAKPFEGRRLNLLVIYCLGFSKITSLGLSAAFDVQFNLGRIITTAIGIIIIVIQGILTIITMIAILVGAVTSYMSVSRNVDDFRPRKYLHLRERYFDYLDRVVNETPPPPKPEPPPKPKVEEPKDPYFEMVNIRRIAKIEDQDTEFITETQGTEHPPTSKSSLDIRPAPQYMDSRPGTASPINRSRAASTGSRHGSLPYGARPHRPSWSQRDFDSWNRDERGEFSHSPVDMTRDVPDDTPLAGVAYPKHAHVRTSSRSSAQQPSNLRKESSNHSLRNESNTSTREAAGRAPAPAARQRTATYGSGKATAATFGQNPDANRSTDVFHDASEVQPAPRKQGRYFQLTPAQEAEEFSGPSRR